MEEQSASANLGGAQPEKGGRASRAALARTGRFVTAHPIGILQAVILLLVVVVVLQNIEPTSLDFLFWSIGEVPKLLILLMAMVVGGVLWELTRRRLRR